MDYKSKYLKYKSKYLYLKNNNLSGGTMDDDIVLVGKWVSLDKDLSNKNVYNGKFTGKYCKKKDKKECKETDYVEEYTLEGKFEFVKKDGDNIHAKFTDSSSSDKVTEYIWLLPKTDPNDTEYKVGTTYTYTGNFKNT